MKKPETVILYHVYGSVDLYNQVRFSILSLYHHLKGNFEGLKVVIYTDNQGYFESYKESIPLHIEKLSIDDIAAYKGKDNFVHRVKICVIRDCFTKYGSNIFYLDSDTYFTKCPRALFNEINATKSIMNTDDYNLIEADDLFENNDWLLIRRAIRNYEYRINNELVKIPLTTRMWNAGIIGISVENKHLLDRILDLSDQIYSNKRVFTAEQFAFSYYLQTSTQLNSTGDIIFHYWRNFYGSYWKNSYNYHFKKFFSAHKHKSINEQAEAAYELSLHHKELIQLPKQTKLQKLMNRLQLIKKVALTGKK